MSTSILGFDPAALSVFNQPEQKSGSGFANNVYKARPAESKSTDGIYRSTIRIIYSPHNITRSILERQSYALTDARGFFQVVSKLTDNDNTCPIFTAWKQCRYSKNPVLAAQAMTKDKGGNGLFDKRFERYVTIQVMDDPNHPELNGQYMFWKLPKFIYEQMMGKMKPAEDSKKASIPMMDVLFGRAIYLEVKPGPDDSSAPERKTRETSYSNSEVSDDILACTNPDGSPLLNADEQAVLDKYIQDMTPVWKSRDIEKRNELMSAVNSDPNTKKLAEIYDKVIEKMKGFCPDLVAELGYKDWTPEETQRVNEWIAIVLQGQNPTAVVAPATVAPAVPAANPVAAQVAATPVAPAVPAQPADDGDDLPF